MKYIDLYVKAVGRKLPARNREDIEQELRSILMDMLDDRAKSANRPVDEEMELALLNEYGSPDQAAARYLPEQHLISPKLYPIFWMIIKIVLSVLAVTTIVSLGIEIGRSGADAAAVAALAGGAVLDLVQSGIQALGYIVIVFAIISRFDKIDKSWNPGWDARELLTIRDDDKIKPADPIITIVFATIGIVIFNFYPDLISIYQKVNGRVEVLPILTDAFFGYLIWFNILWALEIIQNALLLKDGTWTRTTQIFEIILKAASIVFLVVIISGPAIVQLPAGLLQGVAGMSGQSARLVQDQFATGFRTLLGLVAVMVAVKTGIKIFRLARR